MALVPKRLRRMQKSFESVEARFVTNKGKKKEAWTENTKERLYARVSSGLNPASIMPSREGLVHLANDLLNSWARHPNKTHLFPGVGTVMLFEFSRGVAKAFGVNVRLRTILTPVSKQSFRSARELSEQFGEFMKEQVTKLKLEPNNYIIHDKFTPRQKTNRVISAAVGGLMRDRNEHQMYPGFPGLPSETDSYVRQKIEFKDKDGKWRVKQVRNYGHPAGKTDRGLAMTKRLYYQMGVVAAKALLKDETKRKEIEELISRIKKEQTT